MQLMVPIFQLFDQNKAKSAVAELKVKSNDNDVTAESECFYNMFGEAVKLTLSLLCKGRIVQTVTMYGIVVSAHNHSYAQVLKLKLTLV